MPGVRGAERYAHEGMREAEAMSNAITSIPITIQFHTRDISEENREEIGRRTRAKLAVRMENAHLTITASEAKDMAQADFEASFLEVMGYTFAEAMNGFSVKVE